MSFRDKKFVLSPINFVGAALVVGTALSGVYLDSVGRAHEDHTFNINFSRGVAVDPRDLPTIEIVADLAAGNADYTIVVTGHTGTAGDHTANVALGERRAVAIEDLLRNAGVNNTITTIGAGGTEPLDQLNNESDRDFQSRLSRATISVESDL